MRPLHETASLNRLALILGLLAQAVALFIITAGLFSITFLPPDSFYYVSHLPVTYWWGLGATIALLFVSKRAEGRIRTILELSSLLLMGRSLFVAEHKTYRSAPMKLSRGSDAIKALFRLKRSQ